jgi:serpin B
MKTAFDEPAGSADFSRMARRTQGDHLAMSAVFHGAEIEVDEKGTTASAATMAFMTLGAPLRPPKPIEVHVDRPFLLAIQETKSGACLMLGRVTEHR